MERKLYWEDERQLASQQDSENYVTYSASMCPRLLGKSSLHVQSVALALDLLDGITILLKSVYFGTINK